LFFPAEATQLAEEKGDNSIVTVARIDTDVVLLPNYHLLKTEGVDVITSRLYLTDRADSWEGDRYSGVVLIVWLQHEWQATFWGIYCSQFIIVSLVIPVWHIPMDEIGDRLNADLTLILTSVGLKYVVSGWTGDDL
jgi:hypothetical protein